MKFSIIIPAYNIKDYIEECVDSVVSQKTENKFEFEVLLIDDGSTDSTSEICDNLTKKSPQVRTYHKKNGGLSDARNFGIRHASGEYIFFLDGDDFWSDVYFLKKINDIVNSSEPDVILFSFSNFYNGNKSTNGVQFTNKFGNFKQESLGLISEGLYSVSAWQKCIKLQIIKDNNLTFALNMLSEDCLWSSDILNHISTYAVLDSYQYMYRQNRTGSITSVIKEKNVLDILRSIDIILSNSSNTENPSQNLLATYYYLAVLPNIYMYKSNNEIYDLAKKYSYLCHDYRLLQNKNIKARGSLVKLLGFKGSAFTLFMLKQLRSQYRKLK
ncbi:glycosyltransferase family 2 protein [Streptococcus sp. FSL R7-0212]|uniref:glycosyltransferase family 2 protein n=1 Tax=Streptococcus sp. FSL R7-0212 TaxID=2921726 RepID=UPI0030FD1074